MRLNLRLAMAAIALGCFGLAALCRSSYLTSAIALSLTLLALIFATVRARSDRFWRGFAVAGWLYFGLHLGPWADSAIGRKGLGAVVADMSYATIGPRSRLIAGREGRNAALADVQYLSPPWVWNAWTGWENGLGSDAPFCPTTYLRTVHCLLALLIAWLGGAVLVRVPVEPKPSG